jgi:DNA-directed RNA polymerase subunit K/omega
MKHRTTTFKMDSIFFKRPEQIAYGPPNEDDVQKKKGKFVLTA